MKRLLTLTLCAAITLAGCGRDAVIVDTKGMDTSHYQQDRAECETYADQVSTGGKVAKSAGFGAAVGAAIAAIFGDKQAIVRGAGTGGVLGGAQGAVQGEGQKDQVLRNCLRGRGYHVLN